MKNFLLISDDLTRSTGIVSYLEPTCVYYLYADTVPDEAPDVIVCDVSDLGSEAIRRLRRLLVIKRPDTSLIMLLRHNTPRARMQAVALGADRTFEAPFDLPRIQSALEVLALSTLLPENVVRRAEAGRAFYSAVFVPDRPIAASVIDTGTELVGQAIRETGIRHWILAVRQFDDATHQHCLIVAGLAVAFAGSLGLCDFDRHRLARAALLHDVGKIRVPAAILNKPGRLDPVETAVMRRHPAQGEAMLAEQGFEPELLAVVRSHHEMLDGSGYPDGLRGEAIPDLVRLVTVCDIYGALIERRSYKPPMGGKQAYRILEGMVGQLDLTLVSAFKPVASALDPSIDLVN